MTGLMYYRPDDHIKYLQECLKQVKDEGADNVRWNIFIEAHKSKDPLPPIGECTCPQHKSKDPLPPIGKCTDPQHKGKDPLPPIGKCTDPQHNG